MIIASLILGTWVLTLALTESAGPWGLLDILRRVKWIDNMGLLNCGLCVGFYVSIIACLFVDRVDLMPLVWGGSVLLDKLITAYTIK